MEYNEDTLLEEIDISVDDDHTQPVVKKAKALPAVYDVDEDPRPFIQDQQDAVE